MYVSYKCVCVCVSSVCACVSHHKRIITCSKSSRGLSHRSPSGNCGKSWSVWGRGIWGCASRRRSAGCARMRERGVESREVLDISRKPCVNMGSHIFAFHESCEIKEKEAATAAAARGQNEFNREESNKYVNAARAPKSTSNQSSEPCEVTQYPQQRPQIR